MASFIFGGESLSGVDFIGGPGVGPVGGVWWQRFGGFIWESASSRFSSFTIVAMFW